ncbi:dynein heavy chain 9, axonemal [Trichonephila clavipes]|nr:dynein heavy chain 9, axonemal [Trichonephila clavipes]
MAASALLNAWHVKQKGTSFLFMPVIKNSSGRKEIILDVHLLKQKNRRGGRWDFAAGCIVDPLLKDLHPPMPVICLKSVLSDKVDVRNSYGCPVYRTRQRGSTFVWEFPLKTNEPPEKWVIAGTALLLQV